MGNISKNLLNSRREIGNFGEYLKNSLIFHFRSCHFHSCRFCFCFWLMVDLPKPHQNSGTKLDRVWSKPLSKQWNATEITKNGVGVCILVVKPTKYMGWGSEQWLVGPLEFFKIPLSDDGVHLKGLEIPRYNIMILRAYSFKTQILYKIHLYRSYHMRVKSMLQFWSLFKSRLAIGIITSEQSSW